MQRWEVWDHTSGAYCDPHKPEECEDCKRHGNEGDYYLVDDVHGLLREVLANAEGHLLGFDLSERVRAIVGPDIATGSTAFIADNTMLKARIAELEQALRFYADAQDFYLWDANGTYVDSANDMARTVLGHSAT